MSDSSAASNKSSFEPSADRQPEVSGARFSQRLSCEPVSDIDLECEFADDNATTCEEKRRYSSESAHEGVAEAAAAEIGLRQVVRNRLLGYSEYLKEQKDASTSSKHVVAVNGDRSERLTWHEMLSVVRKVVDSLQNQDTSVVLCEMDQEGRYSSNTRTALRFVPEEVQEIAADASANLRREIVEDVTTAFRKELEEVIAPIREFQMKMERHQCEPEKQVSTEGIDQETPETATPAVVTHLLRVSSRRGSDVFSHRTPRTSVCSHSTWGYSRQNSPAQPDSARDVSFHIRNSNKAGQMSLSFSGSPSYMPLVDTIDAGTSPIDMVEELENLSLEVSQLEEEETELNSAFDQWQDLWRRRHQTLTDARNDLRRRKEDLVAECENIQNDLDALNDPPLPPPPGPHALSFVDGMTFGNVSMLIIALNLVTMALQRQCPQLSGAIAFCDEVFLVWYTVELTLKCVYYQKTLLFGRLGTVWWNWLDLCIVVSGIVDQWCMPLATSLLKKNADDDSAAPKPGALRMLRLLRLFRVLRALRFAKMLFKSDMSWTEGAVFQWTMTSVIAVNTIVMSLELDLPWGGWLYVENIFLIIYSFEIFVRIKAGGRSFFKCGSDVAWNYLDFVMVLGGVLDLWLMPLITLTMSFMANKRPSPHGTAGPLHQVLVYLKIMRLLRVLRLVRLMREVKALYVLMMGVWESLKAMQWVLVLTMLVLYAGSIIFTNLVGRGYMYDGSPPPGADKYFGSVTKSLFSLFKLMNGDTSVVDPITDSATGQLLFVGFMIVSNWAVLAILTSVVSDHMISASARESQEEERLATKEKEELSETRLRTIFEGIDSDGSGVISEDEWKRMLDNPAISEELSSAANLEMADLMELFSFLAVDKDATSRDTVRGSGYHKALRGSCQQDDTPKVTRMCSMPPKTRCLAYSVFMEHLKNESHPATKRSILHLLQHMKFLHRQVSDVKNALQK